MNMQRLELEYKTPCMEAFEAKVYALPSDQARQICEQARVRCKGLLMNGGRAFEIIDNEIGLSAFLKSGQAKEALSQHLKTADVDTTCQECRLKYAQLIVLDEEVTSLAA